MKAVGKTIRWLLAVVVFGGSVKLFLDTVSHVPGPRSLGLPFWFWYGNWRGFLSVAATSILFLLAFTLPRRKVEWRNAGLFTAFFISLFFEMFGLPLTIFLLAPLLDLPIWIFGHMESHLWAFALAWVGILPLHVGTYAVMVVSMGLITVGVGLVAVGWATIYRGRRILMTSGIYSFMRHPQYLGLILIILAFNIQWPTLPTLLMSPVLIVLYVRQARREDGELEAAFGQEFRDYAGRVPAFFPFRRPSGQRATIKPSAISFLLLLYSSVLFDTMPAFANGAPPEILRDVGFDQKLNKQVPLDLVFRDESGASIELREYFGKRPVILVPVYYECSNLCPLVLDGLVRSLKPISFDVGNQFNILTLSIDPSEGPEIAKAKKQEYVKRYGRPGAEQGWHFLTGEDSGIRQLTQAIGFRYTYDANKNQYAHPSGIIILTPQGRISRYFYGIEYSPRDLRLGLVEHLKGRSARRWISYFCFVTSTTPLLENTVLSL